MWLQVAVQDLVHKLRSENSNLRAELQRALKSNESTLTLREDIGRLLLILGRLCVCTCVCAKGMHVCMCMLLYVHFMW